jgi:hypothetical protein
MTADVLPTIFPGPAKGDISDTSDRFNPELASLMSLMSPWKLPHPGTCKENSATNRLWSCQSHVRSDFPQMLVPGSATAAEYIEMGVALRERSHAPSEIDWIALFQITDLAQVHLIPRAGVGSQAADPPGPIAGLECGFELERV